jgi:hypothetical protein
VNAPLLGTWQSPHAWAPSYWGSSEMDMLGELPPGNYDNISLKLDNGNRYNSCLGLHPILQLSAVLAFAVMCCGSWNPNPKSHILIVC